MISALSLKKKQKTKKKTKKNPLFWKILKDLVDKRGKLTETLRCVWWALQDRAIGVVAIGKFFFWKGLGYCRRVVSSPINRLAGSFERRERDSGDWERRQRKKRWNWMCSCQCFSCINFWGVEKAKLGQGEQRTGYFSLEFGLDWIGFSYWYTIWWAISFQWADKNLKAREAIYLSLNSSSHNFAVFSSRWSPGWKNGPQHHLWLHYMIMHVRNHTSWLELFLWIWLRSTIFFISHWISAPSWYREYQTRPDWEEKSGAVLGGICATDARERMENRICNQAHRSTSYVLSRETVLHDWKHAAEGSYMPAVEAQHIKM